MKNTIKILAISALVSVASCGSAKNNTPTNTTTETGVQKTSFAKSISTAEFKKLITAGEVTLVDVRTPGEFSSGHIENATNINYSDKNFITNISKLDKSKAVYIYCRSGGRSGRAMRQMKAAGFQKIYDLSGGIMGWSRNGFPTVK